MNYIDVYNMLKEAQAYQPSPLLAYVDPEEEQRKLEETWRRLQEDPNYRYPGVNQVPPPISNEVPVAAAEQGTPNASTKQTELAKRRHELNDAIANSETAFNAAMTPTTDIGRAIAAQPSYTDRDRIISDMQARRAQRQRDNAAYADTKYNSNLQYLNRDRYLNSPYGRQQKAQLVSKNEQDYVRSRGLQPGNTANGQKRYNDWYNNLSADYRSKIEQGAKNIAAQNQTNKYQAPWGTSGVWSPFAPRNAYNDARVRPHTPGTINWGAENRNYNVPEGKSQATINGKTQTWNAGTSPFSQKEIAELQGKSTPGSGVPTRTLAQARSLRNQPQPSSNFGTFAGLKGGPTMRPNALGNSPFARA